LLPGRLSDILHRRVTCNEIRKSIFSQTVYILFFVMYFMYRSADKCLALPTSRCILFDGENISFDASLYIYTYITNIPPNMIYK
jgi:hypothetical protein